MSIQVETATSSSKPRRWTAVAVAVVAIASAALISQGVGSDSAETTTTLATFEEGRLDARIPGFAGELHVILTINGIPTYVRWPAVSSRPDLVELDTPGMELNADLSQVATINFISGRVGDVRVGPPGGTRAITPDVTSYVWHDSDPTRIAITRTLDDTSLWVVEIDPDAPLLVSSFRGLESGQEVVAYGEWGFALRTEPDSDGKRFVAILDPNGEETLRVLGDVVGSIPGESGGMLIADPLSADVFTTWTADQISVDTLVDREGILAAVWSSDLTSYAELANGERPGVDILYVRRGSEQVFAFEGYEPISWDPSGRFLAASRAQRLVIIDAGAGEVYELGFPPALISDARFGP